MMLTCVIRVHGWVYRLELPAKLEYVYNVFHISQLQKYVPDLNHDIIAELVVGTENLVHEEPPVQVLDYKVKHLRSKSIPLIKILLANHTSSKATWETKEDMRSKYPNLFEVTIMVSSKLASFEDKTYFKRKRL